MSQQYDYSKPPPPPSPRPGGSSPGARSVPSPPASAEAAGLATGSVHGQRSRPVSAHLPAITTAFLAEQGAFASQILTPVSGTQSYLSPHFLHSSRTPSGLNPNPQSQSPGALATSPGAPTMEPYNPRQWSNRGQVSGSQMVFQQRHATVPASTAQITGMEGSYRLMHVYVQLSGKSCAQDECLYQM